jgi:hypothetical protein
VIVNATLDALGGAVLLAELRRLEKAHRLADTNAGITRTIAQRRAAALVTMALRRHPERLEAAATVVHRVARRRHLQPPV